MGFGETCSGSIAGRGEKMGQREEQIQDQQLYDELLEELIEDEKLEDA